MKNYFIDTFNRIVKNLYRNQIEPQVKQKCDRDGNSYWQIYDPVSGSHCFSGSEQEIKIWLEQRHYH